LTPPDDSPVDRPHPVRRHTVRIVQRRTPSRAAMLSLLMAMATAAVAFAVWRWWRPAPTVPVYQRTINDVELNWKCDAGHSFIAPGQVADRPCAMCDKPAYALASYECKQHGLFEVAVRFAAGPDGASRMSQFRVHQGAWSSAGDPVPCPHCGEPMLRKQVDPLDTPGRGKKRGG
jgi:hypothetical protein